MATNGHIRDLPSKNGSVDPKSDFSMIWECDDKGKKTVTEITKVMKEGIDRLILATDPDREGEAIAWHVKQILADKKLLKNVKVERIVFHEITKNAILEAIKNPRDINQDLVDAYLTRRALDYLFGFTLSPVLWRKLPGAKSAGRVQSVALRLIVDKEQEILKFKTDEYWSIHSSFLNTNKELFKAKLKVFDEKKLEKLSIQTEEDAVKILNTLKNLKYKVSSIESKEIKRQPSPPFMTSTLQQEASRKLGFSVSKTMRVAQKLYEGLEVNGELTGLISYMRTDSVNLSNDAMTQITSVIKKNYGTEYLEKEKRVFKNKVKNAQEAHEAIRPTSVDLKPQDLSRDLDDDQLKLYTLIWKRTVACQMSNAIFNQVSIEITDESSKHLLQSNGSTLVFDGFLKLYKEDQDDEEENDDTILPKLFEKEDLKLNSLDKLQHFTQPPARFTEASLIKKLEELGIGRPSTYASLIQVLKDRSYVHFEKKHFVPEGIGFLLTQFLKYMFEKYVKYDFTATMEEQLDVISSGEISWKKVIGEFWGDFSETIDKTAPFRIRNVIDYLEVELHSYLFPNGRNCSACSDGELNLKLGKFGAFLGCSKYPDCKNTTTLFKTEEIFVDILLGVDPATSQEVYLKKGPFGFYFEYIGSSEPKRVSVPSTIKIEDVNIEMACFFNQLPKILGKHEDTDILVGVGRFGPYIKHMDRFQSIPKKYPEFWNFPLDQAIELLKTPKVTRVRKTKA